MMHGITSDERRAASVMLLVLATAWYILHFAQELAP